MENHRRRYKRKRKNHISLLIFICIISITALFLLDHMKNRNIESKNNLKIESSVEMEDIRKYDESNQIATDDLYSSNAILISVDNNQVLLDKSSDEKIYPASLTKIMTAILAIENLPDLNHKIYLSKEMFQRLRSQNASMAGFLAEERVVAIDLIYGVLLPSGAESSIGLANEIAGSEKEYVKLMNKKAEKLGMKNTHFTNSTGLHDTNHYSTVNDIAKLLEYALQNDIFREVYTSKRHTTEATNFHPDGIAFESTMFKKMDTDDVKNGTIQGGKTGYTEAAKLCLASLATIDGKEYILVTANADGSPYTEQFNILDAFTVYNQIFDNNGY